MAKTRLSNASYVERGYGQVEPNHLSAKRTGEIYAQLPAAAAINVLEQGQFAKYDYAHNEVNFTGAGEWMLVYNEVKIYDERETEEEFALIKGNYASGEMVPRLFKTHEGDIFTTNCVNVTAPKAGDVLYVGTDGILTTEENGDMKWEIATVYTLADGQKAVKLVRIA